MARAGVGVGPDECTIPEVKTWPVPSDECIEKLRTNVFKAGGSSFECEGWTAWWATKEGTPGASVELAEGKSALPAVFIGRSTCNETSEVVCVMAIRKLGAIGEIAAPQPFPTVCTEITKATRPTFKQACVRGNLDWQREKRARPKVLNDISPPSPPERDDNPKGIKTATDKLNCTTCHVVPYVASTRHLVMTLATKESGTPGELLGAGKDSFKNPDDNGNWLNTTETGTKLIRSIIKHNRVAASDPTKLVWKEVTNIPWFGKNTGQYKIRGEMGRACAGSAGCHTYGFPINNRANWTQDGDKRDIASLGGKAYMDKNYCEFVAGPAFARDNKPITFDASLFRGGMHFQMADEKQVDSRKWQSETMCKSFFSSVGCEPDADKQKSLVDLCKKSEYSEVFIK